MNFHISISNFSADHPEESWSLPESVCMGQDSHEMFSKITSESHVLIPSHPVWLFRILSNDYFLLRKYSLFPKLLAPSDNIFISQGCDLHEHDFESCFPGFVQVGPDLFHKFFYFFPVVRELAALFPSYYTCNSRQIAGLLFYIYDRDIIKSLCIHLRSREEAQFPYNFHLERV